MLAEPFSAVIEPATVWARAEGAAKTSSKTATKASIRLAGLSTLRFNTAVLGKPMLTYNGFIALRVDLVKFFELKSGELTPLLLGMVEFAGWPCRQNLFGPLQIRSYLSG
jgi:hypothetical protein